MAMVRTASFKASGNERAWRRKRGESPSISGATGGGPSSATRGMPSCSESTASISRLASEPMSTRILPSLSPRSRWSSRARSRSSCSMRLRSMSIRPRGTRRTGVKGTEVSWSTSITASLTTFVPGSLWRG